MTREFYKSGQLVPVTVLKMEKARVIQVIEEEKRGYKAVQLGYGKIKNSKLTKAIKADLSKKDNEKKKEAIQISEQINGKEYGVKKLSTENNELYGSVKPTEIAKLIQEENKIDIKPSMIQPIEEIKSLGKFKVKVSLHSEVDAEITIKVESAETIQ